MDKNQDAMRMDNNNPIGILSLVQCSNQWRVIEETTKETNETNRIIGILNQMKKPLKKLLKKPMGSLVFWMQMKKPLKKWMTIMWRLV